MSEVVQVNLSIGGVTKAALKSDGDFYFNNNVGIGQTSPSYKLDVNGTARVTGQFDIYGGTRYTHFNFGSNNDVYIRSGESAGKVILQDGGGNVGIGTTSPAEKLQINGTLLFDEKGVDGTNTGSNTDSSIIFGSMFSHNAEKFLYASYKGNLSSTYNQKREIGLMFECSGGGSGAYGHMHVVKNDVMGEEMKDTGSSGSTEKIMSFRSDGNMGIGTTSPKAKLQVNGSIVVNTYSSGSQGGTAGIFFRESNSPGGGAPTALYNCSIMNYAHNETGTSSNPYTPDGISINGYDGVSICTGSNTRNERMRITNNGVMKVGTTIDPTYGYSAVFGPLNYDEAGITAKAGICIANGINNYAYIRHGDGNSLQIQCYKQNNSSATRNTGDIGISPYGGRVGIGTASPEMPLDVASQ